MFQSPMRLLLLFASPLSQWTPDQLISAVRVMVWPVFWAIVLIALREKVVAVCDVAVKLLERADEFEIAGVKFKRVQAEPVDSLKEVKVGVRFTSQPLEAAGEVSKDVPEKLIELANE